MTIINTIEKNPKITIKQIVNETGISKATVEREMKVLKESNRLKRIGPDKSGHWEVD